MTDGRTSKGANGSKNSQWQNQLHQQPNVYQNNQQRQQNTPPPAANYTLPGVIHYLTSEFTNLERFKIMTNIERSEMKYRIVELEGQINSLKYINEHQKVRIAELELRLSQSGVLETTGTSKSTASVEKIPHVDLDVIRDARNQLASSMREVVQILKSPAPSNASYLNLPDAEEGDNEFEELFDKEDDLSGKLDDFTFADKPVLKPKQSVFAQYLEDIPVKDPPKKTDVKPVKEKAIPAPSTESSASFPESIHSDGAESEAETVVIDDDVDLERANNDLKQTSTVQIPKTAKSFFCDTSDRVISLIKDKGNQTLNITTDDESPLSVKISPLEGNIVDIFCIDVSPYRLLAILDNGEVKDITLSRQGEADTISYGEVKEDYNRIISTDMYVGAKSVFLAINGILKESLPLLNTYSLANYKVTKLDSFDREFFTTIKADTFHSFEAVHWVENQKHLIFRLAKSIVKLDLEQRTYKPLVTSDTFAYGVHSRNYYYKNTVLVPEYSNSILKIRAYNCLSEQFDDVQFELDVVNSPESLQVALTFKDTGCGIYVLHKKKLKLYAQHLALVGSCAASGTLRRISDRVVVTGNNYSFYDLE